MDRFWWDPFPQKNAEMVYIRSVVNNTIAHINHATNEANRFPGLRELQMFLFGAATEDNRE